jgi:hypothetical protein
MPPPEHKLTSFTYRDQLDSEEIARRRANRGGPAPKATNTNNNNNNNNQTVLEKKSCVQFSSNESKNNTPFPLDLWWLIALYTDAVSILKLQSSCKLLFTLGQDENIWIYHLKRIRPEGWEDPFGASYKLLEGKFSLLVFLFSFILNYQYY